MRRRRTTRIARTTSTRAQRQGNAGWTSLSTGLHPISCLFAALNGKEQASTVTSREAWNGLSLSPNLPNEGSARFPYGVLGLQVSFAVFDVGPPNVFCLVSLFRGSSLDALLYGTCRVIAKPSECLASRSLICTVMARSSLGLLYVGPFLCSPLPLTFQCDPLL